MAKGGRFVIRTCGLLPLVFCPIVFLRKWGFVLSYLSYGAECVGEVVQCISSLSPFY